MVAKRLRTGAGAEPHTTFEKKLPILKGELFFLDKDLLMGADHGESSSAHTVNAMRSFNRNPLLQFFKPIQDDVDTPGRLSCLRRGFLHHKKPLAVGMDVPWMEIR